VRACVRAYPYIRGIFRRTHSNTHSWATLLLLQLYPVKRNKAILIKQ